VRGLTSLAVPVLTFAVIAVAIAANPPVPRATPAAQEATSGAVTVLDINGPIGPATSRYIERGIAAAQSNGSRLVVLQMDTPGGLDTSMRDIIHAILASTVPVATYVAPSGSRAASAGTYILYASHIAAMAPATNVGAATPVSIGGEPAPEPDRGSPGQEDRKSPEGNSPDDKSTDGKSVSRKPAAGPSERKPAVREPATAMERKVQNDAVAYVRGLAELRGRNAEWAEEAVRGAASLSANDALSKHVIDLIARDLPDLLAQIDGREVKIGDRTVKLATRGLTVQHVEPDWRTRLLSVLTNPTVAYGLLLIGIYGLLFEGYNPGMVLPGVVGAIALLCALFAFQILSVNYAGLALVALGIGMIIGEFFMPTFGSLGVGGLIAFVVGSIILLDTDVPGMNIGLPIIAAVATVGGLVMVTIVWVASRSMRRPVVTGVQAMVGATAQAFNDFTEKGTVRFGGELWNAHSSAPVRAGQQVRILKVDGLSLWVEPL
jgi:membrane-bound serine protease (ClpP class)